MLKNRIISAVIILSGVFLAATLLPPLFVLLFTVALSSVAQMEFYRFMKSAGMPVHRLLGLVCGAALITVTMLTIGSETDSLLRAYRWEQVVLVVIVLSVFIAHLFDSKCEAPIESVSCTLLGIMYVPFLFNFYMKLAYGFEQSFVGISDTGRMLIFYSVVVIKITDVGAYFTGRLLGRHKMFPRVSPGKTWEGFAGGIVWAVAASMIFCYFSGSVLGMIRLPMMHAVILGFILALSGVVGDLFESLMKRAAGAKDSGTKVPGMGGLMDVFDSLLFGVPVLYVYVKIFLETS
jgi:phosphatidate cytidylyltransferase